MARLRELHFLGTLQSLGHSVFNVDNEQHKIHASMRPDHSVVHVKNISNCEH